MLRQRLAVAKPLGTLALGAALAACATADSPLGAPLDAAIDAPVNPDGADGAPDSQADGPSDATSDASPDAAPDAAPDGPLGNACDTAPDLTAAAKAPGGTVVNGDTSGGVDNVTTDNACTGYIADGQDDVYKLVVIAGDHVAVTMQPTTSWDASVELVAACGVVSCLKGSDVNFGGVAETLQHTFAAAGTFYLVADGYNPGEVGPYSLTVVITHP